MSGPLQNDDVGYEEEVLRNPYSVRGWLRYLDWKREAAPRVRYVLYERALAELPGSHKLWAAYLRERTARLKALALPPRHPLAGQLLAVYERALVFLHKMPRVWLDYCGALAAQGYVTRTRHAFDRALRALPVSQHDRIWPAYLQWVRAARCPDTAVRVYRRFLRLEPTRVEDYIDYLVKDAKLYAEAAQQLARVLNHFDEHAPLGEQVGQQRKTRRELWLLLCELLSKQPAAAHGLNVELVIRGGLQQYADDTGRLWSALADYHIRCGHFEKARDVFEEALAAVASVKDFSQVWDAYVQFEDALLAARMQASEGASAAQAQAQELELLVARYEALIERRALLLSSVLLRQDPHNVREWHKRVKLFEQPRDIVDTFSTALRTVDPSKAHGKPHTLWVAFARFYEAHGDLGSARKIFERAVQAPLRSADELAALWADYAELELRHGHAGLARGLLQRALAVPGPRKAAAMSEAEKRLHKSTRLWGLLADLEESAGDLPAARAVYERVFELRVATPQLVLNFARLLEQHAFFEESFKAYERGVQMFAFPHVLDIWLVYLHKFVARYGGRKLERARDLFEQALEKVPARDAKLLLLMYADLEERHGLARHAMAVYERATKQVHEDDRPAMFRIYIARAAEFFGVTRTREIFERAIEALPERHVKDMCLRFADMERKLGEVDRARQIYVHASQFCDPKVDEAFWSTWADFEVRHGSQDTFREMLRIKRSVQALFNTQVNVMAVQMGKPAAAPGTAAAAAAAAAPAGGKMEQLEAQAAAQQQQQREQQQQQLLLQQQGEGAQNPEEIAVGDDDDGEGAMELAQKDVPAAVFQPSGSSSADRRGALARLKRGATTDS